MTAASADPSGGTPPLARAYRRFAAQAAATSPLYAHVAAALADSDGALRAIAALPASKRHPRAILAALQHLALQGRASALAAAYAAGDGEAAAAAAIDTLVRTPEWVQAAGRRLPGDDERGRYGVLQPAVAEAARRSGAAAVGLIDVGRSAGLNLSVAAVGVTYSNGQRLGDSASPVQRTCTVVGDRPLPEGPVPEVVARVVVDREPLDVADPADACWLRACVPPDQPAQQRELEEEIALAATTPALRLRGDPLELLPDACARVPADVLPVVLTTWALSRVAIGRRPRLVQRLTEVAGDRPVAWVSVEGVGVAPGVPTLGDRPASGHSIIGLTVVDRSDRHTEALGRCWSRGSLLAWLGAP